MRLSGMSSGMDIDSIVSNMLKVDQMKLDKFTQQKTKAEWKADAYRSVNNQLRSFRSEYMSVLNPSKNMMSSSAFKQFKVDMLTDTKAVGISTNTNALTGKVKIDSIDNLAKASSVSSGDKVSAGTGQVQSVNTKLGDLTLAEDLGFDGEGNISFNINGSDFTFNKEDTLSAMMNKVNTSDAGVRMTYSQLSDSFTITSKTTGSVASVGDKAKINITNGIGNAFGANGAFGIGTGTTQNGEDAMVHINGIEVTRSSNNFTIDGITYDLKAKSTSAIEFSVSQDVDSVVDRIKNFVNAYNDLVASLDEKYNEPTYRAYAPLTDEQRQLLSEKQQEEWDKLSKSGMLRSDSYINSLANDLRSSFYNKVEGVGKSLSDIGLQTGTWTSKGKIVLDEAKLRAAITNNPDEVEQLFTNASKSTDSAQAFKENGLMMRISNIFTSHTSRTTDNAIASIEKQITNVQSQIDRWTRTLESNEKKYYAKFTAMETAIAQMNSQSSWFSAQFSQ